MSVRMPQYVSTYHKIKQYDNMRNKHRASNIGVGFNIGSVYGFNINVGTSLTSIFNLTHDIIKGVPEITPIDNTKSIEEIKKMFDFNLCRLLYDDYSKMNDEDILKHYSEYGHNEKRIIFLTASFHSWFNPRIYKFLNDDLNELSDEQALKHYVLIGYNENKFSCLSSLFSPKVYKMLNSDLADLTDDDAMYHYAKIGRKENKKYKCDNITENTFFLKPGDYLVSGQFIKSQNKIYKFHHQKDGNVVFYKNNVALWSTNTCGKQTTHFVFEENTGNLVLYNESEIIWCQKCINGIIFVIQDDGNFVMYNENNEQIYGRLGKNITDDECCFHCGDYIVPGQTIISPNKQYSLTHQLDGNVVIYYLPQKKAIWNTSTHGKQTTHLIFQYDGNFILYNNYEVVWALNYYGGNTLTFSDDSNLIIRNINGNIIWSQFSKEIHNGDKLCHGDYIRPNTFLESPDGKYMMRLWRNKLIFSHNNLSFFFVPVSNATHAIFQYDCSLEIYNDYLLLWSSKNLWKCCNGLYLSVNNNGICIYDDKNNAIWNL